MSPGLVEGGDSVIRIPPESLDQIPANHVTGPIESVSAVDADETVRIVVEELIYDRLEVLDVIRLGNLVALGEDLVVGDAAAAEQTFDHFRTVVLLSKGEIDDETHVDVGRRKGFQHVGWREYESIGFRDGHVRPERHFKG